MRFIHRLPALLVAALMALPAASLLAATAAHAQAQPAAPAEQPAPGAAPADASKAPAPTPPAGAGQDVQPEKVTVENPYGLEAVWKEGDFVSKGTLVILVLMSMGTWYIAIVKFYEQMKLFRQARAVQASFWQAGSVQEGVNNLKEGSAFRFIAESGIKASQHHDGRLLEQIDLNTWITMSIQRAVDSVTSRMQDGLAFLATVGSTAPFVGLFGTVWGIYHALTAIGISGSAAIDKVAGPVGEALIMTAVGLAVAVPAVLLYNWLVRRNKVALEQLRNFGADLHMVLMGGAAGNAGGARRPAAATTR